jgi:hypothetical protein
MTPDEISALVDARIKEILRELLSPVLGEATDGESDWVPLKVAYKRLGYESRARLYGDIAAGLFRIGTEVRDRRKPGRKKPVYQINISLAEKRLVENPIKRRVTD